MKDFDKKDFVTTVTKTTDINFNDCLSKFNTENFVLSQFILIGTNGPTGKKSFFTLSSGGCFTKVLIN